MSQSDIQASAEDLARHLSYFVPPGFQLMRQEEIDRILNECEALRIERDAARKGSIKDSGS